MRLNKSTSHAIRILIDCANAEGGMTKVADLSQRLAMTQQNVFKIVSILTRAGLIRAMRGRYGGVALAHAPETIRVGDIVRAMETTEIELDTDGDPGETTGRSIAEVNRVLDGALDAFVAVLDQHTLADLARGLTRRAPAKPNSLAAAERAGRGERSTGATARPPHRSRMPRAAR